MDKTKSLTYVAIVGLLCFAVSCGGTASETATAPKSKRSAIKRGKPDPNPVDERGKSWKGWRWSGKRDNCFFVYRNRCFSARSRACAEAKCGKGKCAHKGGGPAEIYCRK